MPVDGAIRVAYFPDSFHEVNGVAHTSRQFEDFARRRSLPFLCVRAGTRTGLQIHGSVSQLEFPRGMLAIPLEKDLKFDPVWMRNLPVILRELRAFRPDIVHVTGPSEVGLAGAWAASRLNLPLAASWHTNLHEYAAARSHWFLESLPSRQAKMAAGWIEEGTLRATTLFYRRAQVLFAPNPDLCAMLKRRTRKPCHLMQRGIDAQLFCPERRRRDAADGSCVLGFVGRLSVEKNVRLLAAVQQELEAQGFRDFRFRIVGHGSEDQWLREHLPRAEFTGVLRGEALAQAYADMDVFVFPSHTETFGNVVLEALASGVPAVVTPDGGPRSLVQDGRTGFIVPDQGFPAAVARLLRDPALRAQMGRGAREYALAASWDAVFDLVCGAYRTVLRPASGVELGAMATAD